MAQGVEDPEVCDERFRGGGLKREDCGGDKGGEGADLVADCEALARDTVVGF